MLVIALVAALVFVLLVVAATIRAVLRDGHGPIADYRNYDSRRPLP